MSLERSALQQGEKVDPGRAGASGAGLADFGSARAPAFFPPKKHPGYFFLGMTCLKRNKKNASPLVSSQERRALAVLLKNHR